MKAILLGERVISNRASYDLRYFYFDDDDVGHSTCGIAFQTLLGLYRETDTLGYNIGSWYSGIAKAQNPTVLGYLAEHVCLEHIQRFGLRAVDPQLDRLLGREVFHETPDVERLITGTVLERRLYTAADLTFSIGKMSWKMSGECHIMVT